MVVAVCEYVCVGCCGLERCGAILDPQLVRGNLHANLQNWQTKSLILAMPNASSLNGSWQGTGSMISEQAVNGNLVGCGLALDVWFKRLGQWGDLVLFYLYWVLRRAECCCAGV